MGCVFDAYGEHTVKQFQRVVGTDFNPGPESFTNAARGYPDGKTQVGSVAVWVPPGGEKTNDSGYAIESNLTRGGTPQDV